MAQHNITIDHTDPAVVYSPLDCYDGLGWKTKSGSDYSGGSFTYCAARYNPSAVFRFTGVAVYFLMARDDEEYLRLSLDGGPHSVADLTSPTGGLIPNEVVWSATNLANQEHVLEIIPGDPVGGPDRAWVEVDGFIVTTQEGGPGSDPSNPTSSQEESSSSSPIPSDKSHPNSTESSSNSSDPKESGSTPSPSGGAIPLSNSGSNSGSLMANPMTKMAVIAGAAAGVAIVLAILAFFLWRRLKKKKVGQNERGSICGSEKALTGTKSFSPPSPTPSSLFLEPTIMVATRERPDNAAPDNAAPPRSSVMDPMLVLGRDLPNYTAPVPDADRASTVSLSNVTVLTYH